MKVDCQWGPDGAARPADVAIIVDVMSFSTTVSIAIERGARVFPYWRVAGGEFSDDAETLARLLGAKVASRTREKAALSLSPESMTHIVAGEGVVIPSPNGATASLRAAAKDVLCGCLRNAKAVAETAASVGGSIVVVPAGERWPGGAMRIAFEDMMGAGAIISHLGGDLTPEARAAAAAFEDAKGDLRERLRACASGVELIGKGFPEDVELAADLDVATVAPMLAKHRARYRDALANCDLADKRVRYYEDARG